jgi:hypothetical protein
LKEKYPWAPSGHKTNLFRQRIPTYYFSFFQLCLTYRFSLLLRRPLSFFCLFSFLFKVTPMITKAKVVFWEILHPQRRFILKKLLKLTWYSQKDQSPLKKHQLFYFR